MSCCHLKRFENTCFNYLYANLYHKYKVKTIVILFSKMLIINSE